VASLFPGTGSLKPFPAFAGTIRSNEPGAGSRFIHRYREPKAGAGIEQTDAGSSSGGSNRNLAPQAGFCIKSRECTQQWQEAGKGNR